MCWQCDSDEVELDSGGRCRACQLRARLGEKETRLLDERLKEKYGIGYVEYKMMEDAQGGTCALCNGTTSGKRLAVDHDHETGAVRGLLCFMCNTGLGLLGDTLSDIERAAEYLRKSKNTNS